MNKTTIGLILVFVLAYMLPLGSRSLVTPDETRYGEIAREMNASGDYVVPRLNGLRYFEKPAGGHFLNAMSMKVFGDTRFGVRFASAAMVGLAAFALFMLVRRELDEETAALATLIYLTSVLVQGLGTFSALDSMVSGFITLCLCFFYRAATEEHARRKVGQLLLMGLFAGWAFLVKGFLAFAVPVLVIVPFLLWSKQWKRLFTLPWLPIVGILVVALPWSFAVASREADFWNYFFWEEHIHRFSAKGEAEHSEPFWFFIPVLLAGALPWLLLSPLAFWNAVKTKLDQPIVRFAFVWLVAPFLFFSASSGKLPTYILPCFPPLAVLFAVGLLALVKADRIKPIRVGMRIFFIITCVAAGGLLLSAVLPFENIKIYADFERGQFIDALVTLVVASVLYGIALRREKIKEAILMFGLATAALMAGMQLGIPGSGSVSSGIERFLRSNARHVAPNTIVVADGRTAHAVCFIYQRDDAYMLHEKGELDYGLAYPDAEHRYFTQESIVPFLAERGTNEVVAITREWHIDKVLEAVPEGEVVAAFRYLRFVRFPALVTESADDS